MQQKDLNILGTWSKLWTKVENFAKYKTGRIEINLCEFKEINKKSIIMLEQVFLMLLMKEHKSKQILEEKVRNFSGRYWELFGLNFREE